MGSYMQTELQFLLYSDSATHWLFSDMLSTVPLLHLVGVNAINPKALGFNLYVQGSDEQTWC